MYLIKKIISKIIGLVISVANGISMIFFAINQSLGLVKFIKFDYNSNSEDIFIVTYPRSGTTLMQMVLYQLTSDGDMDFVHISEKIPFFERIPKSKFGLEGLQQPRIFKTHLNYKRIPKSDCKYIYCYRNGKDVASSYYQHHKNYQNYSGTFAEFHKKFLKGNVIYGSWFSHVDKWLENKKNLNVKLIKYEDLISDKRSTIKEIADFCNIQINEDKLENVINNCSFDFMKKHESKFDHATELLLDNGVTANHFIRKGQKGNWKTVFNDEQIQECNKVYNSILGKYNL